MGEEEKEVKAKEQKKGMGLTMDQLQSQLDEFESQRTIKLQEKVLLRFDMENYKDTLNRKIRMNLKGLKLDESNIKVIKREMSDLK